MEKISGIIPRNARTSSADTSKSQPVRPGAPSFGRPIGKVTPRSFSSAPEEVLPAQEENVPARLADNFFIDNKQVRQSAVGKSDNILTQEDAVEDKVTFSPNVKELKKLQDESNDFETEILTRVDNSQKSATQQATQQQAQQQVQQKSNQYNKKGESVKTKIANDVSKNFASIEA